MEKHKDLEIIPNNHLKGVVSPPGSKSFTNRALLIAGLARGRSRLCRPLWSDDTRWMSGALRDLGLGLEAGPDKTTWEVPGCEGMFPSTSADLYVGNAGTAMRFLTAALCLGNGTFRIDGDSRMRQRPIQDLLDGLEQLGANISAELGNGCPPVRIRANGLKGGKCRVRGDKSSQFISAILLAAPYTEKGVILEIQGELVSKPYVHMTLQVMKSFGVEAFNHDCRVFEIPGRQVYEAREYHVEPDASNASYYFAAGAIASGPVRVLGLSMESSQGDIRFLDALREMGCNVAHGDDWIEVSASELRGRAFDFGDTPDVAQTLAVVALFADGQTEIRNVANLRIKETDRLAALAAELRRLGATVREGPDFINIIPGHLRGTRICTYNDHRMAMSFALAGARVPGVIIQDAGCVSKTYPGYFDDMRRIGLDSRPV